MKRYLLCLLAFFTLISSFGCIDKSYPEGMTKSERKAYYKKYNESKSNAEWKQISLETRNEKDKSSESRNDKSKEQNTTTSVAFSIKNNSLFSKKLKIADNILSFSPLEKRFLGFEPNTKVYLIKGKTQKYLFTITEKDLGKKFRIN